MANFLDENDRKDLYRKMLADNATSESTKKYSFKQFETKILGDDKLLNKLSNLAVKRDWAIDQEDFFYKYAPEKLAKPQPQVQAAPAQQFPMGIAAPSVTDIGREMASKPSSVVGGEDGSSSQLNAFNQYGQRDLFLKEIQKTPQDQIREAEDKSMALYPYANKPDIDKAIEEFGIEEVLKNIPLKEKDPRIQKTVTQTPSSVVPELLKPLKNEPIGENAPIAEPKKPGVAALPNYKGFFDSPTAKLFSDTVPNSKYRYGAKDVNGPDIDCSGAVCHVLKQKGIEYDSATTNAAKLYKNAYKKNIPIEKAADGDIIAINTEGKNIDHIGFVVRDKEGNLGIAESSSSYNGTTITPFKERIENLKQLHPNMKWDIASVDKNRKISGAKVVQPASVAAPSQTITDIGREMAFNPPAMQVSAPVEEKRYTPPPQPLVGSPEYDKQLQSQYGGMSPTLGATFEGAPASFETKEQKKQEQLSPVFKAQQLAFEDVPIASEQRKAQREFAKAEKQQQQAAIRGGTGFEYQQKKKAKERGLGEWSGDLLGTINAGGKRIGEGIVSTLQNYVNGTLRGGLIDMPATESVENLANYELYKNATNAQNAFQEEVAKRNIQTSVLQAIENGEYSKIPEATLYTIGDAAMQIIPAILTMGGSTYFQTLPQAYKDGVDAIAKEKGMSPEQVVASGEDAKVVAQISTGVQSGLEFAGANLVSSSIASRGGYKVMRDYLLKQGTNRNLARGASLLGVGIGEGVTEYLQEGTGQIGTTAAKSETTKAFLDKLPKELFSPEAKKQRREAFVGGFIGGGALGGAGQTFQSAMDRTLFEAPKIGKATQRADMDIVLTDDKIQQRNRMLQAMESLIKANPEAEGQIREKYRKLTDALELTDEEVLSAYDNISQLPPSPEKDRIIQGLEAYMAEKGIQPEAAGMEAGLGEGMRVTAPSEEASVIQAANPQIPAPTEEQIADDIQNKRFATFTYKSEEEVPEQFRDRISSTGEINGERFVRVTLPQSVADYELSRVSPEVAPEVTPESIAPTEEVVQEDEDLASLGQAISGLKQAPVEEAAPEQVVPSEEVVTISPLNIDFTKNEGRNVNYQGIEGRIKIDSDGAPYIFTRDADVVYIEGGLSGQTPQQLGVQPLADDVINEADVETVLEDETAPLDQNQLQYDFDNNTITLYGRPFSYEGVETNSKGQTTALRLRDANGKIKFVRNEDTILEFEIQKELYEKSRTNKQPTIESATAAAEQLQVVPIVRVEQVSEPVQQEGSTSDTKGDKVAPAPKGRKKAAPVKPTPAAPKKEEAPKPQPKKEETPKPEAKAEEKPTTGTPQEGDAVEIAPQREGGSSRKMVFKDGEWKQNVGGDIVKVGPSVQGQAQEMFAGKTETKAEPAKTNEEQIAIFRAEEQAELDSRIKNADKYRGKDGKVDRTKLTKKADIKAFDEVYDKYDKLISPLMETKPTASDVESTAKSDELIVKKYSDKEIKRQLDEQGFETKNKTAKELRDLYKKEVGTDEYKEPPRNNYKLKVVSKKRVGGTDIRFGANSSDRSIRNNTEKYGEPIFDEKTNEYVWKTNTHTLWEMEDTETGKKYSIFGNKEFPFSDIEQGQPPNYGYIEKPKFNNGDIFEISANPEINKKYGNTTLKNARKQSQVKSESLLSKEQTPTALRDVETEFTSKQESSASTEFDGTKKPSKIKMNSFDGKHGKGAFQRMKNITDNFEDIMDGLSEKIKQDCL